MTKTVELKVIKCSNKECGHEIITRKCEGKVQCKICGKRTEIK